MPPNLDDNNLLHIPSSDLTLFMSPLIPNGPLSDDDDDEIDSDSEEDDFVSDPSHVAVPLEHNLRALLVQVTGTEDLARVTQVKLRVIARDVPLQHLSSHIPALRELILDGSILSSFRDLGSGLKNLKILKVNRCGVDSLDSMLGLESLEELHAADNLIEDCIPCAFLPNIKHIDLRRNRLKNATYALTFLTICEKLEHIYLEGNDEIWQFPKYRQTVKSLLPALKSLDGSSFTEEECNSEVSASDKEELRRYSALKLEKNAQTTKHTLAAVINGINAIRNRPSTADVSTGFVIRFPPNVFLDRPASSNR